MIRRSKAMTPHLFLDLDGVFADFEGHFTRCFGQTSKEAAAREGSIWGMIDQHPDFFLETPLLSGSPDLLWLASELSYAPPIFLTACPPSPRYNRVAAQKKEWVKQHLGAGFLVLPVCGHLSTGYAQVKPNYMQNPGDILVDDYGKNCVAWKEAGGVAIQHTTGVYEPTFDALRVALS